VLGSLVLNALTNSQENVTVARRAGEFLTSGSNNVIVGGVPRMGPPLEVAIPSQQPSRCKRRPDFDNVICFGTKGYFGRRRL